jgi:hypothetical protein
LAQKRWQKSEQKVKESEKKCMIGAKKSSKSDRFSLKICCLSAKFQQQTRFLTQKPTFLTTLPPKIP